MSKQQVSVKFQVAKNGQRWAYRWCWISARWFRMGVDEAELLLATGQATRSPAGA